MAEESYEERKRREGKRPDSNTYVDPNPAPKMDIREPQTGPSPLDQGIEQFKNKAKELPFFNTSAFQTLYNNWLANPGYTIANTQGASDWINEFTSWGNTFANQFKNLTGRAPNESEYNEFFQRVILPQQPWKAAKPNYQQVSEEAKNLISNTFSNVAAEESRKKAEDEVKAALAPGSAFDEWQKSYMSGISDVEKSLQDYQTRLFEKIRPQLLTSLQSQGLLNTGGLNEAFAGVQSDLGNEAQNYMANIRLGANQDIANTKYAIQSSPSNYSLGNIYNTVPYLQSTGQTALQNVWNAELQRRDFENQMRLAEANKQSSPSLLSQYGGLILGGVASGLGQRLAGFGRGTTAASGGA